MKSQAPLNNKAGVDEPLLVPADWYWRLLAGAADLFFTILFAIFLFCLPLAYSFNLYGTYDAYGRYQQQVESESLASHLAQKDNNGISKSQKTLAQEYVAAKIADKVTDDSGNYLDILAGYFLDYQKGTLSDYNITILGLPSNPALTNSSPLWEYPASSLTSGDAVGVLHPAVKTAVSDYLYERSTDATSYNQVLDFFNAQYVKDTDEFSSRPAYLELFDHYVVSYRSLCWNSSFCAEISFFLSAALFYIVLPCFAFKGNTFGRLILKLKVTDEKGQPLSRGAQALRGTLEILTVSFGFTLVPFFSFWGPGFMSIPFIAIGTKTLTFGLTMVILFMICLVSAVFMMASSSGQALHDRPVHSYVLTTDIRKIEATRRLLDLQQKAKEHE